MESRLFTGATPASHFATQREISARARDLYDTWTDDYDHKLLGECGYRAPARVARVFHELPRHSFAADLPWLDLAAGSGLVGRALTEANIELPLIAVDFSRTMLSKLSAPCYIACVDAEVLRADGLRESPGWPKALGGAFAVGLSEYVADLSELFRVCAALLPPQAPLIFSYCPSASADCEVFEPFNGLLAHSEQHVNKALTTQGFALLSQHDGLGYQTAGQDVMHRIVLAERRSA
ncbi:MAG TPA: hypothetical protein VL137_10820 [Polyangiaceae bacterium]|nr:hypothetical protein [Polyangiaceae bacterium]